LAQIIQCTGNDYNPFVTQQPLPISIPPAHLHAAGLTTPLISLTLAVPFTNPLLAECETIDSVFHCVAIVKHIINFYIQWITQGIRNSLEQGEHTAWNWGVYWGMLWDQFRAHLGIVPPATHLGKLPGGVVDYDLQTIDNSLVLILHPTLSSAAISLKERANAIVNSKILTELALDLLTPFQNLFIKDD
jgi:hypothetical protein